MPLQLPVLTSVPWHRVNTTINGYPVIFEFTWNARDNALGLTTGAWYFDLMEQDETPIVNGVKIVLGTPLGRRSTHQLFRNGVLFAFDTSRQQKDAGFDDLGARVVLRYYTGAEVMTIR